MTKLLLRGETLLGEIIFKRIWPERIPALDIILKAIPAVRSSNLMAEASGPGLSKKCMVSMDTGDLNIWIITRESSVAYCYFHWIKYHLVGSGPCQLIDMYIVSSSGMDPENVSHLVNFYRTARMAWNINIHSEDLGYYTNGLCKNKQAVFERAAWPANFQYCEKTLKHISREMLGLKTQPANLKTSFP